MPTKQSHEYSEIINGAENYFYNFHIDKHVESRKEATQWTSLNNQKIAKFKFIYREYIEQYEQYIEEQGINIGEVDLISFYDFIDYYYSRPGEQKKINPTTFFNRGMIGSDIFKQGKEIFYINFLDENNKYANYLIDVHNTFKNAFPFYTEVQFDSINGNNIGLVSLLDEYGIRKQILEEFVEKSGDILEITTDTFINNNILDVDLFTRFDAIKNKKTFTSLDQSVTTDYEVLGYRLQKYPASTGYSRPIQQWIIPSSDKKTLEIIDSQIKYGTNYYYTLSIIVAVHGAKYSKVANRSPENIQSTFFVYEILSTDYEGKLISSPPTPPEVQFVPIMDNKNKIKILLATNVSKRIEKPVAIFTEEDRSVYRDLLGTDASDVDGNIYFESLQRNKSYQVIKLDRAPKDIADFSNGKLYEMSDGLDCFVDEIPLNRKHYYIFRSVDVHNLVSNPTHVYTAEMVSSDGATYPIFGMYDFNSVDSLKESFKSFRKFFSVTPQINHLFSSESNADLIQKNNPGILNDVQIGVSEQSIWDKQFKIRLTSISTGKKMDFNLTFKKTKK